MAKKTAAASGRRVAVIDGVRTPFLRAGTEFNDLMAYDLGRYAVAGLLGKSGLDPNVVDMVMMGCVIADPATSNVAREIVLGTDLPDRVPAYTISEACISANQAICNAVDQIARGYGDVAIAGGTDITSDVPIRYQKRMRQKFLRTQKAKGLKDYYEIFHDVKPADLVPDPPGIADFFTGLSMGGACDRICARLGVSREEQDEFAARSHQLAHQAAESGLFDDEVIAVAPPPHFKPVTRDNGVRGDTTYEKMAKLRPAFDKNYGTVTAGNASFLTDGAAAVLLMSEEKAKDLGYKPKAYIIGHAFRGTDPLEEMLLGQTYATPTALARAGISFEDLGVLEIHEAFAGQMVATVKLLESKEFGESLGLGGAIAKTVNLDILNIHGGSLSIGHPFGATGARLIHTCANRMQRENKRYGLVAACALSGLGNATVLERA